MNTSSLQLSLSHSRHARHQRTSSASVDTRHPVSYRISGALAPSLSGYGDTLHASAEDFFAEIWKPGLLDSLHTPLTRYHE